MSISTDAQIRINGKVFYDVDELEIAQVKVFQDNKSFDEFPTSKKGKFKIMLPLGHDYLFEVSKPYHFTTRLIVSTKMPEEKLQQDVYASFDIVADLIRNFEGLDGSIMDNPIMILRYIPEEDAFDFDKDHLEAVRSRVEKLMNESEKLQSKGAEPIAKPLPPSAPKKQETKLPPPLKDTVIEENNIVVTPTHTEDDQPIEEVKEVSEPKEEILAESAEQVAKSIEEKPTKFKEEVKEEKAEKEVPNETYEMQLRRERLEKEKKRNENLALKRGYESSLIRQVAEENRKMSRSEYLQKAEEKEDESLILKAKKEQEMKAYQERLRKEEETKKEEALVNQRSKAKFQNNLLETAISNSVVQSKTSVSKKIEDGDEAHYVKPIISTQEKQDEFKSWTIIKVKYPTYTDYYMMERYQFGLENYYKNNSATEKDGFCRELKALSITNQNIPCN